MDATGVDRKPVHYCVETSRHSSRKISFSQGHWAMPEERCSRHDRVDYTRTGSFAYPRTVEVCTISARS